MADSKVSGFNELTDVPDGAAFYIVTDPGQPAENDNFATKENVLKETVKGPATNTADYLPQWNGANSKTLKDGISLTSLVEKSLFDANTILAANLDNTPAALTVAEQRILGRITGGNIGALTAAEILGILLASTVAGDLPYYSNTAVLARLAKGAANTKLFMNAGATAPEWAGGMKLVTATRDVSLASGTQAVTGVGFKPSMVISLSTINGGNGLTIGIDDGTTRLFILDVLGTGIYIADTLSVLGRVDASNQTTGYITTLGADGWTWTWTKTGSPTGTCTINSLAIR